MYPLPLNSFGTTMSTLSSMGNRAKQQCESSNTSSFGGVGAHLHALAERRSGFVHQWVRGVKIRGYLLTPCVVARATRSTRPKRS